MSEREVIKKIAGNPFGLVGLVIFFMLATPALRSVLDHFEMPDSYLRDALLGAMTGALAIGCMLCVLKVGKNFGWINKDARLPWND